MQMDGHKTLYPFYTANKKGSYYGNSCKNALRWQQWFFYTRNSLPPKNYVAYRYQQLLFRCITCHRCLLHSTVTCGKTPTVVISYSEVNFRRFVAMLLLRNKDR